MIYQRILLKLSGEALGDSETGLGLDPEAIVKIAAQIAAVANGGVEVGVVGEVAVAVGVGVRVAGGGGGPGLLLY